MKTIDDGGPAYPTRRDYQHGAGTGTENIEGMTLRDSFAGMALPAKIADAESLNEIAIRDGFKVITKLDVANSCYGYADAMLEARKKDLTP